MDELANSGKRFNVGKGGSDLLPAQTHHFGIYPDILRAGQFRIETRPQFEQRSNAAPRQHPPRAGLHHPADNLQQRALPVAGADEGTSPFDGERMERSA